MQTLRRLKVSNTCTARGLSRLHCFIHLFRRPLTPADPSVSRRVCRRPACISANSTGKSDAKIEVPPQQYIRSSLLTITERLLADLESEQEQTRFIDFAQRLHRWVLALNVSMAESPRVPYLRPPASPFSSPTHTPLSPLTTPILIPYSQTYRRWV